MENEEEPAEDYLMVCAVTWVADAISLHKWGDAKRSDYLSRVVSALSDVELAAESPEMGECVTSLAVALMMYGYAGKYRNEVRAVVRWPVKPPTRDSVLASIALAAELRDQPE